MTQAPYGAASRPASATALAGAGTRARALRRQSGSSLVMVLIMLTVIFAIGLISSRMSLFAERSARNDKDRQIAFQSAEAALLDAELDIYGPNSAPSKRVCVFDSKQPVVFVDGCGTGAQTGMCLNLTAPGDAWKVVKGLYASEAEDSGGTFATSVKTVQYGRFTGQAMPVGTGGGLPYRSPRYIIEAVRYAGTGQYGQLAGQVVDAVGTSASSSEYAFLVTAMGFGSRPETQVLLQALIYKPANKPNSGC